VKGPGHVLPGPEMYSYLHAKAASLPLASFYFFL
jgi:hypothetical protein